MENEQVKSLDAWIKKQLLTPSNLLVYLSIFVGLFFILLPLILTTDWGCIKFDSSTGVIGDTFGGIFGPFVALLGVVVTFFAFYMQFRANQIQNEIFKSQDALSRKQSIENRVLYYYNLIKDVKVAMRAEVGNDEVESSGRSFTYLLNELKHIYALVKATDSLILHIKNKRPLAQYAIYSLLDNEEQIPLDREIDMLALSWHYCFSGLNRFTQPQYLFEDIYHNLGYDFLDFNEPDELMEIYNSVFGDNYDNMNQAIDKHYGSTNNKVNSQIENTISKILAEGRVNFKFDGNTDLLSQYFQLFYQVVKFVNSSLIMEYPEKYNLVKLIRAQMSKDEMVIFFINSIHELGRPWEFEQRDFTQTLENAVNPNSCFVTKYNLIKNITEVGILSENAQPERIYPDLIFVDDSTELRDAKKFRRSLFT